MEKEIRYYLLFCIAIAALLSCKKFVDVPLPKDRVVASRVFTSDAKAASALTALYGNMINGSYSFANGFTTVYGGLSSDELLAFNPSAIDAEVQANNITTSNAAASVLWKTAYQYIYDVNAILEGVSSSPSLSDSARNRITGECKFIRAFCYFYLTNFFGDVPLISGTDYRVNAYVARSSKNSVYAFLLNDLLEAKSRLSVNYNTPDKTRPNKYTVQALLSRVYLYKEDWAKAEAEATDIINSNLYLPLQAPNTVFLKNSKESIWQLSPTNGFLKETQLLYPLGGMPQYYLSSALVKNFEPGDLRRSKWVDSVTYSGTKYYYPAKYRNITSTVNEYYTVFRVAEVILIRAEARMQQNNLPGAIADINMIRTRASLAPLLTTIGQAQVEAAIEQERRSELFAEWGHRWFDLIRWNKASAVLSPLKSAWKATSVLFPIPLDEIIANSSLTQNPGY